MKKMVLGIMLFVGGLIGTLAIILVSIPGQYNNVVGIFDTMGITGTILPFIVLCILSIAGLIICFCEAYNRKS